MNAFAVNGIFIAITGIPLAIIIAMNAHRDKTRWLLSLFTFAVGIWGLGGFFISRSQDPEQSLFLWRLTHVGVIMIPAFLFHFVSSFLEKKRQRFVLVANYVLAALFQATNLSGHLIQHVRYVFNQFYYDSPPTLLYVLFVAYFVLVVLIVHWWLIQAFRKAEGERRTQITFVLLGTGLGFAGGTPSFLPVFQIDFYPLLNFSVILFSIFVAIAVLRYHLLRMKVVATETLVFGVFTLLFFELFFSRTPAEVALRIAVLVVFLYVGYLLIRSVIEEIKRREEMERLTHELEIAYDKLKEVDQAKTDFLSLASHQLRAPLTVIKVGLGALLDGVFGPVKAAKQRAAMNTIVASADRLVTLIGEYLDISRIELGRMEYHFVSGNICTLANALVGEYTQRAETKGLKLTYEAAKQLPKVSFDEDKMRQVITNLIDNAIKYTPAGTVSVRCTVEPVGGKTSVVVSVTDSGRGLSKEDMGLIFQKFKRASGKTMRMRDGEPVEGSGLGLYVAKMFVEAHKGKIWAESRGLGKGTVFKFSIPIAK